MIAEARMVGSDVKTLLCAAPVLVREDVSCFLSNLGAERVAEWIAPRRGAVFEADKSVQAVGERIRAYVNASAAPDFVKKHFEKISTVALAILALLVAGFVGSYLPIPGAAFVLKAVGVYSAVTISLRTFSGRNTALA